MSNESPYVREVPAPFGEALGFRLVSIGVVALLLIVLALGLGWQDWQDFREQRTRLAEASAQYGADLIERERWRIEHQARLFRHAYPALMEDILRLRDRPQELEPIQALLRAWFPGYKTFSFFRAQDCDVHLPQVWQPFCQTWIERGPKLLLERMDAPLGLTIPFEDASGEGWVLLINREFTPFAKVLLTLSLDGQEGRLVKPEQLPHLSRVLAYTEIGDLDWMLVITAVPKAWEARRLYIIKRVGGVITLVVLGAGLLSFLEVRAAQEARRRLLLERTNAQLFEQATHDALTGLFNRYAFHEHFQRLMRQAQRLQQPVAVLLLDIDYFKHVNDHWGHEAGDELLRKVAAVIGERARRPLDMAARLGGEEFALLLDGVGQEEAWALGELLRLHIADKKLPHPTQGQVSVSIGVACSGPQRYLPLKDLLELADHALYAAKRSGRNRVVGAWELVA